MSFPHQLRISSTARVVAAFVSLAMSSTPLLAAEETAVEIARQLVKCLNQKIIVPETADSEGSAETKITQNERMVSQIAVDASQSASMLLVSLEGGGYQEYDGGRQAEMICAQLLGKIATFKDCAALAEKLLATIRQEAEAKTAASQAEIAALRAEMATAITTAKKPEEMDPFIERIEIITTKAKSGVGTRDSNQQLGQLSQIVAAWQDYLASLNAGDRQQAGNALSNLNRLIQQTPVVPRSFVIERQMALKGLEMNLEKTDDAALPSPITLVENVSKPSDLPAVAEKLRLLAGNPKLRNEVYDILLVVERLMAAEKLINEGNPMVGLTTLRQFDYHSSRQNYWAETIRRQLMQIALIQSTPESMRPDTSPEEYEKFVHEVAARMVAAENWAMLWEFLQVVSINSPDRNVNINTTFPTLQNDISAIEKYLQASRQEAAEDFPGAVNSYLQVLQSAKRYAPIDASQGAIKRIKTEKADVLAEAEAKRQEMTRVYAEARVRTMPQPGGPSRPDSNQNPENDTKIQALIDERIALYFQAKADREQAKPTPAPSSRP